MIVRAAREVFSVSGLKGARTRDIAARADVVESVLFDHFESKEALFEAAILAPLRQAVAEQTDIARAAAASGGASHADNSIKAHERFLTSMLESYPLLRAALLSDPQTDADIYRRHVYPLIQALAEVTRERAGRQRLKNVDVEFMTLMGFGVHFMVAMDHYHRGGDIDIHETARKIAAIFARGIEGP
jgi:AcrR family transcriptional regulator